MLCVWVHGYSREIRTIDTTDRATMLAWGETDALFVDRARVRNRTAAV